MSRTQNQKCFAQLVKKKLRQEGQEEASFFSLEEEQNEIFLTRPGTTSKKAYSIDGAFETGWEQDGNDERLKQFYKSNIRPLLADAVSSPDIFIWSFGTFSNEGISDLGWFHWISYDLLDKCGRIGASDDVERIIVSASLLGVTGDDQDRVLDCFSAWTKPRSLRVRERNHGGGFYFDNITEAIVTTNGEVDLALQFGKSSLARMKNSLSACPRIHLLFSLTFRILCKNGDLITKKLSIMDLCGIERRPAFNKPANSSRSLNKEDRTLKAIHRIIDTLASAKPGKNTHIPFRDSKLTKALSWGFNPNTSAIKVTLLRLDITDDSRYDEARAILDLSLKLRHIFSNETQAPTTVHRINRQREAETEKECAAFHARKLGIELEGLKSSDIQLDMESSLDLVDLRNALAKIEALQEDPLMKLESMSRDFWSKTIKACHE